MTNLEDAMKKIILTLLILALPLTTVFAIDAELATTTNKTIAVTTENTDNLLGIEELSDKTIAEVASIYGINEKKYAKRLGMYYGVELKTSNNFSSLIDVYGLEPKLAIDMADAIKTGTPIPSPEPTAETEESSEYHLSPIVLFLVGAYILSRILSKKKINILKIVNHKKIWNILLMIAFVISGVLGVLLVIRNNTGNTSPMRFDVLFWHVELGIAMLIISIFHILERWYYFARMFKKKTVPSHKANHMIKIIINSFFILIFFNYLKVF